MTIWLVNAINAMNAWALSVPTCGKHNCQHTVKHNINQLIVTNMTVKITNLEGCWTLRLSCQQTYAPASFSPTWKNLSLHVGAWSSSRVAYHAPWALGLLSWNPSIPITWFSLPMNKMLNIGSFMNNNCPCIQNINAFLWGGSLCSRKVKFQVNVVFITVVLI